MNYKQMAGEMIRRQNWIVMIGISAFAWGCGGESNGPAQKVETAQGVQTQKIQLQNVPDEFEASGSVIAATTAQIAARTMGTVLLVAVREGDFVKRGQLLAQLDERELAARHTSAQAAEHGSNAGVEQASKAIAAAQAQADVAKKTYDRYVYLKEQKSVSPQEFDEVAAKNQAAQAGLEQTRAALQQAQAGSTQAKSETEAAASIASYARVVAPFVGRVVRRTVEPGSLVSPGMPLFVVEDASRYQLEVTLPADSLATVHKGSMARVQIESSPEKPITGKVAEIEAGADPVSHTAKARIDLPKEPAAITGVQSGMFGRAFFAAGEKHAFVVPSTSVMTRGQLRGIYIVEKDGWIHWRVLTLGKALNDKVEVLSGLNDGDVVVLSPGTKDLDGKKIARTGTVNRETLS